MRTQLHFDEAQPAAISTVREWLHADRCPERVLLVFDVLGKLRLIMWGRAEREFTGLDTALREACGPWWTGEILDSEDSQQTAAFTDPLWNAARRDAEDARMAVLDRHRNRTGWFLPPREPLWPATEGPAIVVFYSFKGGLGRSTLLASYAIQRARMGERVCVIDMDLDSPGVGTLLAADTEGLTAQWGVVDYLLEQAVHAAPFSDYYHRCDRVAGNGEIIVMPAGRLGSSYAEKLARVDMDDTGAGRVGRAGASEALVRRVRDELKPHWILVDARAGISEPAGLLLSGLAHMHVLLGTTQEQSWQGLRCVIERLGKDHLLADLPQGEVVLVQAMVPQGEEAGAHARERFAARAEREFTDTYYAAADDTEEAAGDDRFWDTRDMENSDAPHVPCVIEYSAKLANFSDISKVAEELCAPAYAAVAERISSRCVREEYDER